jgi:hypothetical protein
MGVTRLWDLLAPAGRKAYLESLSQKRLAIGWSRVWSCSYVFGRYEYMVNEF